MISKNVNDLHLECTIKMLEEILNEAEKDGTPYKEIISRLILEAKKILGHS